MKPTRAQKSLFILGIVLAVAALPLLGGLHHHHDEIGGMCWFCTTAAAAMLPLFVIVAVLPATPAPLEAAGASLPAWFLWITRHRRGPPRSA